MGILSDTWKPTGSDPGGRCTQPKLGGEVDWVGERFHGSFGKSNGTKMDQLQNLSEGALRELLDWLELRLRL